MTNGSILTVSQLNLYVRLLLEGDTNLRSITVKGEISNFIHHRSGHLYMSLKDGNSIVKAVMFRTAAETLNFEPCNGTSVLATGYVSIFERDGSYQFYISSMNPAGTGSEWLRLAALKEKLLKLGVFDEEHKKKLPRFPRKIGLITSPGGAALQDVKSVLSRRYPQGEILFWPASVQGVNAVSSVLNGIEYFSTEKNIDVLIITRGGGSAEDLSVFNDETLAMAVYRSPIPIVSAVGHETDYTVLDFAADLRCPTPSAAAECVSPDRHDLADTLSLFKKRIHKSMTGQIREQKLILENLEKRCDSHAFIDRIKRNQIQLQMRVERAEEQLLLSKKETISHMSAKLSALSPLNTLARGYGGIYNQRGTVLSIKDVHLGEEIKIRMIDGEIISNVEEIRETD